ncbi:MAG: patatin-like phospholipase family protein, partial [Bacteroidales bacterium]|nr:patatin-like phospholipase family protein [Bacteroidales bacterium]
VFFFLVHFHFCAVLNLHYLCKPISGQVIEQIIKERDWDFLLNDIVKRENVLIGQDSKDKKSILSLKLQGLKPVLPNGLNNGQNVLTLINILTREYNYDINFDSLPIPFRCIGTNIETGEEKIFNRGYLSDAMRASMSIPSVFSPYEINNDLYVDGGLVNNFPTDVVKKMGADIVIGVDVGAVLYKKEEINSIIKILDQSASFYNSRVSEKNKDYCDIYIRPNINGLSAMDFNETENIIARGKNAFLEVEDQVDQLIKQHPNIVRNIANKTYNDSIFIASIIIKSNAKEKFKQRAISKLVFGKLKIHPPTWISETELSERINQVYGSQYFEQIKLSFLTTNANEYSAILYVTEKKENNFDIGARYDGEYGVNVLLRAEFRNQLIYGSLFEIAAVVGESPQLKVRYTTDRGSNLGYGSSFLYTKFDAYTFSGDKIYSTYALNYANWDLFYHSYLGNYNRFVGGLNVDMFYLKPVQSLSDLNQINNFYYGVFASYVADTYDRAYFPNKGVRFKVRGNLMTNNLNSDGRLFTHLWSRLNFIVPITQKLKIENEAFIGTASINTDTTLYRFEAGGMSQQRIPWFNSFPGLRFLHHGSNNIWIAKISPRYEFYKNNFISFSFAMTGMANSLSDLFYRAEKFYTGMEIKYGFNSMFGPLELSVDYSLQNYNKHAFISLGFWF